MKLTTGEITKMALKELDLRGYECKEVIHGVCPSKSNCYKIAPGRGLYKTKALADYEKKFFIQCKRRGQIIDEYFEFRMDVFYPNERSDLDNSLKVVLDCLQKHGVIKNDNKCVKIIVQKYLDKVNPRIEFAINTI